LDIIQTILRDTHYHLSLFSDKEINVLRSKTFTKQVRGKETAFVSCIVRNKDIQLKPEEIVRQLYATRLIEYYGYPKKRIAFEHKVTFGREKKSADIVVFDKDRPDTPYIIVEVKKPKWKDGKDQLKSYCNATGAPIAVWSNGEKISHYHRKDPNYFENWRPEQVKETLIPILSEAKQAEIQQKVTESFKLREQSKHLLECAKRAVELAIEQGETTAMQWLEMETSTDE